MDRRPKLASTDPYRPIGGDPDILSHVNAVLKRQGPIGTLRNFPKASRVLVTQAEPLNNTDSTASVAGRKLPKTVASRSVVGSLTVGSDQKKDSIVEISATPAEDSLLIPPFVTGTVTDDKNNNLDRFGMEQEDAELLLDKKKTSLACPSSSVNFKEDLYSSAENSGLTFQSTLRNFPKASRVLVTQADPLNNTDSTASVVGRKLPKTVASRSVVGSLTVVSDQKKDSVVEISTTPAEDSLLNPPFVTGTVTDDRNNNLDCFGMEQEDAELLLDQKKTSLARPSSSVNFKEDLYSSAENSGLTFQSVDARMTIDTRMDDITSYLRSLALTEREGQFANQVPLSYQDLNQHGLPNMEIYSITEADMMEKIDDLRCSQQTVDSMTRSAVLGSSCVTTMSVCSGPTYQCTHASLAGQNRFSSQMSSIMEKSSGVSAHILPECQKVMVKESVGSQHHQQSLHRCEGIRENIVCSNGSHLQPQATSSNISTSNMEPSQSSKVEKAPRKKKYDPNVFFKVNGKLYQKLGKIGSGGSSEVHKVITSDCVIRALKKIKLKGRDYPTAHGFCQEIEYLNKLKGKSNIIQLIDYEVTDKTLLQKGVNGSMTMKDGRIKDDQYIYMVLEYGEIDLAHMLSQKWREVERTGSRIDENWLRFYWQQMLEAVNTIHEERIVHSDLKPANFLLVRGSLKLIDFGIAKAISSETTNIARDAQVGTLNYMSPEAFMWSEQGSSGNTIKLGRPSDIWSLGCILYQMVHGKTPFAEYKTFWSKFKVITDRNHEINYEPTANPLLIDLMKRCLTWDRNERWRIPQLRQHPFLAPTTIPRAMSLPSEVNFLMEKIGLYWDDSEVSRLCNELLRRVDNLERANKE